MVDKLNLTLPERKKPSEKTTKIIPVLLVCLLVLGIANLLAALPAGNDKAKTGLSRESNKNLALKLEKQGLNTQASSVWKEYLSRADISSEEQAKIWYRIGKLYQESVQYEAALSAYYRSEGIKKIANLEASLGRRIQECLEAAGKFSALKYELADRVGINKEAAGEEVMAEIGNHKITKVELDRRIEKKIERQLSSMASFMSEEQRKEQKETLLKKFSDSKEKAQALNNLVLEEILYRKAREDKITENPAVRDALREMERSLLAGQVLEREMADNIKITPSDLETFYQANQQKYQEPEKAKIAHILVKDEETAKMILQELDHKDFEKLAKQYSLDKDTRNIGGEIAPWVKKQGGYIQGIGNSEKAIKIIFSTKANEVAKETVKSDKGIHIIKVRMREPKRQKTFDEVRSEVYRALRGQKETEIQERLFARLREKYNVVIHSSAFHQNPEDPHMNQPGSIPANHP